MLKKLPVTQTASSRKIWISAKGTISNAAKAISGPDNEFGEQWAKMCRDQLEAGELDSIIGKLEAFMKTSKEARQCRDYLITNRHHLNYP